MNKKIALAAIVLTVLAILSLKFLNQNRPELRIYAYSSFTALWGPGPELKKQFEKSCDCKVIFYDAADSRLLKQRALLEGPGRGVDLILGVDQFDIEEVSRDLGLRAVEIDSKIFIDQIESLQFPQGAIPFDWGALTFNSKIATDISKLVSVDELLLPDFKNKIALQDPRTSTPGLQFLVWLIDQKGEAAAWDFLGRLKEQWHSVSSGWSSSYGLFEKGQAELVYSYTTSPLYHLIEEKQEKTKLVSWTAPLPMQVEFMGITKFCRSCQLAESFVKFMLTEESQKLIMTKNYMFPVTENVVSNTEFEKQMKHSVKYLTLDQDQKEKWLQRWTALLRAN